MNKINDLFVMLLVTFFISCEGIIVTPPESNQSMADFEAVWNRINAVYPYLAFKKINCDSIYTVYLPQAENQSTLDLLISDVMMVFPGSGSEFLQVFVLFKRKPI